jgi:hypothetical protein
VGLARAGGDPPGAAQLEWISAAESQKFAKVTQKFEELRSSATPEEIAHAREALKPKPKKTPPGKAIGGGGLS